jgi:tRNA(Ile2) C34 agmatinyltransferase TiaS
MPKLSDEMISKIVEMRSKGATYDEIATTLGIGRMSVITYSQWVPKPSTAPQCSICGATMHSPSRWRCPNPHGTPRGVKPKATPPKTNAERQRAFRARKKNP